MRLLTYPEWRRQQERARRRRRVLAVVGFVVISLTAGWVLAGLWVAAMGGVR